MADLITTAWFGVPEDAIIRHGGTHRPHRRDDWVKAHPGTVVNSGKLGKLASAPSLVPAGEEPNPSPPRTLVNVGKESTAAGAIGEVSGAKIEPSPPKADEPNKRRQTRRARRGA